ncbi:MAG: PAS domain S-box protein [Proteobacteria bacterium]|nr:PAS domain S-box protein [Pseudomonadota bacterium]
MNGLSLLPVIALDMIGSAANIIFSFLAWRYAHLLAKRQPNNFVWGYLHYVTFAIAAFSISRAVGHLIKQFLLIFERADVWADISAYSGGFNTLFMISVAAVMIFYHKGVQAYQVLEHEAVKLKDANKNLAVAADQLRDLNQNLEEKVLERTEEVSQSEKKFRHLFSASKDLVFFCNETGRLVDMNDSGFEMLGYDRKEAKELFLTDLFADPGQSCIYNAMLGRDGYIKDLNSEFVKKNGAAIPVLISATAIFDEVGVMHGSEVIAKDLTKVKTTLEQLAVSEKMASIGQMAAGVAHEINTPLGIILGYSQLLMDDFPVGSEQHQSLQVIERQTKASRKIVADLLRFSRQSESTKELINLNDVLVDVVAVMEHILSLSHISLQLDFDKSLPALFGDAGKLRQVFVNLINNAYHAMQDTGGKLYLQTILQKGGRWIEVKVRDTGCGIPEKNQARIFDPFFTTKPVDQGTGLGLSVSYGIVHEHGGKIIVESPTLDLEKGTALGTLFRITLPVSSPEELS